MTEKFKILTKYISELKDDGFGEWISERENDGSLERPFQMSFVNYSETVRHFINDIYTVEESNEDLELNRYSDILKENNIEWGTESMITADVSNANAQCVMALLMGAVRSERFCEGTLLDFFQNGCILKWLERLAEFG